MADTNYQPVDTGWGPDDQAQRTPCRRGRAWLRRDPRPPLGPKATGGSRTQCPAGRSMTPGSRPLTACHQPRTPPHRRPSGVRRTSRPPTRPPRWVTDVQQPTTIPVPPVNPDAPALARAAQQTVQESTAMFNALPPERQQAVTGAARSRSACPGPRPVFRLARRHAGHDADALQCAVRGDVRPAL